MIKYLTLIFFTTTVYAQQLPSGPIQIVKDKKTVNINIDSLNPLNNVFMPITASSFPLPTGAATEATLSALNAKVPSNLTVTSSKLLVDGSGVTQPISAVALPLPSGAATEAKQDTGNSSLSSIDGKLNSLGQKAMTGSVPVVIASDQSTLTVTGSLTATNPSVSTNGAAIPGSSTLVGGSDGTNLRPIKTNASGNLQVDVTSSALPTGASTSTNQTNGSQKSQIVDSAGDVADVVVLSTNLQATDKGLVTNTIIHGETTGGGGGYVDVKVTPSGALVTDTTLTGLDAGILGQKTMAASLPVVISSNQSTLPISAASLPLPTGAATETTLSTMNGKIPSNLTVTSTRLLVDGSGVTQPVSATSLPLPTGAATETTLSSVNTKIPSNLTVTSTRLLVDGSGVTQPISASSALPTKAPVNTAGSFYSASISSVATVTAPSNAVQVIIQASDANTDNMRFVIGGTASASSGIELQPGRSETLNVGANISIAPVSGSQTYNIQYISQ